MNRWARLSHSLSLFSGNRRGDAGFGRRSAIIGKLKKIRLIHTVTHLACKGLNIRKENTNGVRWAARTREISASVNEGRTLRPRFHTDSFIFDTTKEIIIGQNNVVVKPRRKNTPKTAFSNASPQPPPPSFVVSLFPSRGEKTSLNRKKIFAWREFSCFFPLLCSDRERCASENFRLVKTWRAVDRRHVHWGRKKRRNNRWGSSWGVFLSWFFKKVFRRLRVAEERRGRKKGVDGELDREECYGM